MVENYILGYIFGGLFYGFIILMGLDYENIRSKWLYTIPIWPLTVAVLLIRVSWRGLKVTLGI